MRNYLNRVAVLLAMTALAAPAQTKLTFEVASVKAAAPLDMAKMAAEIQAGQTPKVGAHVDNARAEYTFVALRELIAAAYKVKPFQITGPDWLANTRFDIVAKMPEGSKKDDAPQMLQALLEDRFKLAVHRETKEHPVLALVVSKGGPKMKESAAPEDFDPDSPLKPGERQMDTPDGPVRMTINPTGSAHVNMGKKGSMDYRVDPNTMTMHLEASQVTMEGFADMLTQFSQISGGGGRQVVDMTGLKGNYQVAIDFSLADLMAMVRAAGVDVPGGAVAAGSAAGGPPSAQSSVAASDPGTSSSIFTAVDALGLKLEQRKAPVEQLIIDHVEKTPTEN